MIKTVRAVNFFLIEVNCMNCFWTRLCLCSVMSRPAEWSHPQCWRDLTDGNNSHLRLVTKIWVGDQITSRVHCSSQRFKKSLRETHRKKIRNNEKVRFRGEISDHPRWWSEKSERTRRNLLQIVEILFLFLQSLSLGKVRLMLLLPMVKIYVWLCVIYDFHWCVMCDVWCIRV